MAESNSRKISILYCNLNRSKEAHALIETEKNRMSADVVCCTEPNWTTARNHKWISDNRNDTAISRVGRANSLVGTGEGFCWIDLDVITLYCTYVSPNVDTNTLKAHLNIVSNVFTGRGRPVVIVGDFNSKSRTWGSARDDSKGEAVLDWAAAHNLTIHNDGLRPTFNRGESESFLDLTLSSSDISSKIKCWKVLDHLESMSDHNYIYFEIELERAPPQLVRLAPYRRFSDKDKLRLEKFHWPDHENWKNETDLTKAALSFC